MWIAGSFGELEMTGFLIGTLILLVLLLVISGIVARMHRKIKHLDHEWFSKD